MPETVIGIGTHYYGKRGLKSEFGPCSSCGESVQLQSYETTLWFTVLFIPIIPLGRKRIINYCPQCSRYYVMPVDDWEKVSDKAIDESMREMKEKPEDPDAAIKMHSALDTFDKHAEACDLAAFMEKHFSGDVNVQVYLGAWHERKGNNVSSDACFERALEIEPDNLELQRAVGVGCMQRGELDRARELFRFMANDAPPQNAMTLLALATAYRRKGDHKSALNVCHDVLAWFPQTIAQNKAFRREVKLNEKALGTVESILPKPKLPKFKIAIAAVILALGCAWMFALNVRLASNQPLYIVNALPLPATVEISGRDPIEIRANGQERITLSEGDYSAIVTIKDRSPQSAAFAIENSLIQRVKNKNVFILNVGGAAVFLWEKTKYSAKLDPNLAAPYKIYFNQNFLQLHDIDYPFQPFPKTVQLKNPRPVWRSHVEILNESPDNLLRVMIQEKPDADQMMQFIETHLDAKPGNYELLFAYVQIATLTGSEPRCFAFLKRGLSHRPIIVDWHRHYQRLAMSESDPKELIAQYDTLLQEKPDDPARLYLRGRIVTSAKESFSYYDKALAADLDNPYVKSAKAYHLAGIGKLDEALVLSQAACAHQSASLEMTELLYTIRKLSGDHKALADEASTALKENPTDASTLNHLMENTLSQGNTDLAQQAMDSAIHALAEKSSDDELKELKAALQLQFDYLSGDMDAYVKDTESVPNEETKRSAAYIAHLTKLQMSDANAYYDTEWGSNGYVPLLHGIGWLVCGDAEAATPWMETAITAFGKSNFEERAVAEMLRNPTGPVLEQLDDLVIHPSQKRMLYTTFAVLNENEREQLLQRADTFSEDRSQPYLFLARVAEELRKKE